MKIVVISLWILLQDAHAKNLHHNDLSGSDAKNISELMGNLYDEVCIKKNGEKRPPGPPSFKKAESDMQQLAAGHLGHRIELFCPFHRGCPKADVSWTKDGLRLVERGRESGLSTIRMSRSGELVIEDNRKEDDGRYTCRVENKYGAIQHTIRVQSVARVVARSPSIDNHQPGNHTVTVGSNLTLFCQLTIRDVATPDQIVWFKHFQENGSWTDTGAMDGIPYVVAVQSTNDYPPPEDDQELQLHDLHESDTGWYSCRVTNQYGGIVRSGWVQVNQEVEHVLDGKRETQLMTTYLTASIGGIVALALLMFSLYIFIKYRMERRKKKLAIDNAHRVASWTKKVMIERQNSGNEPLLAPYVRIEKVRLEKKDWRDIEDSGDAVSEYEFQEDSEWEFPRELLQIGPNLGEGAFGKVVQCFAHCTALRDDMLIMEGNMEKVMTGGQLVIAPAVTEPTVVAVKMLKEGHTDADMIDFVKEMEIMKMIGKHVNIINLLGVCTQPAGQPLMVIVEFAEHGNLRDFLRERRPELVHYLGRERDRHVSLRDMMSFGWQIARGMEFLQSRKCVHRDLAARNVLVGQQGVVKIADFGMARDLSDCDYYRKVGEGKLPVKWMSPESLFERICTPMSDIWSFGVLLWEIVTWGDSPYKNLVSLDALLELIKDGYRMSRPEHCPWNLYKVMKDCWMYQPEARPSWPILVSRLLSMYHATLPGEYLELSLPTLPTPPSSPESSFNQFPSRKQNVQPTRLINTTDNRRIEYLIPNKASEAEESSPVTPDTNHHPRSQPHNHHPADIPYSDLTSTAGYQNRLFTNNGLGRNDPTHLSRQQSYVGDISVTGYVNPKILPSNTPTETCEMLQFEKSGVISQVKTENAFSNFSAKKRSYSESSYGAPPLHLLSGKRGSSESGYGTSTTTRSSVSSGEGRIGYVVSNSKGEGRKCCKCSCAEDDDDVFYEENKEEMSEGELMIENERFLHSY